MDFGKALSKIETDAKKKKVNLGKIVVCSRLGLKDSEISYEQISKLKNKKFKAPFCVIIPSELHFMEKEFLESFI